MPSPFQAISGVVNACQVLPTVVTGGQPTLAHLEALKAAGCAIILDTRDPMEPRPFDEPAMVRKLGMEYVNIPIVAGRLGDDQLDLVRQTLRDAGDRPVFFHCASANRVGGALIPYLMIDLGMEEEDAVNEAMRVGLRSAELLEWGLDYARRQRMA
jgi:protein tyrosine phosphatase (PTP) superfamily phosphohydrolase (DUF442 family)